MNFESQHTCLNQILSEFNGTNWFILCHFSLNNQEKLASSSDWSSSTRALLHELDQTIGLIQNKVSENTKCKYMRYEQSFLLACSSKINNKLKDQLTIRPKNQSIWLANYESMLADVTEIRNSLKDSLQNKLQIQIKHLQIYDTRFNHKIPFLGYFIWVRNRPSNYCDANPFVSLRSRVAKGSKATINGVLPLKLYPRQQVNTLSNKITFQKTTKIHLLIDREKVIKSLFDMGFCDILGKPKPNFRYYQKSQHDAIAHASSILRGLACYYELARWKRSCISRFSYIITHSLALTFAAKYKLSTRSKVFALAGLNLQIDFTSL